MGSYRMCVCFTRKFKITEAEPPCDVTEYFAKYAEGGTHMSAEQLRGFLADVQCEGGASTSNAERIVEQVLQKRHHHIAKLVTRRTLTLEDFHHYLFSADLNPPIQSKPLSLSLSVAAGDHGLPSPSSDTGKKSGSAVEAMEGPNWDSNLRRGIEIVRAAARDRAKRLVRVKVGASESGGDRT
ncbi:hypothetical protein M0R45_010895 [Rubus argutus]|uniref:Phosphoinositide-specific phospholipase C EF-hand-like domain-containing protein n=1 Tax=Rubus argutus TaxID=59490 RepID=A0AAW1YBH1_RUBAR